MHNERRRRVLQAVVDEYVVSALPVGSKTLVDRYDLNCSSATVRSELSALEECGHLAQPHVSAGRIPTDAGYRSVVDEYLARDATADHGFSEVFSATGVRYSTEIDELMRRTSSVLSAYTNCLALAVAPSISTAMVAKLNLLSLSANRALFVLVTDSGRAVNRSVELRQATSPEELAAVERALNAAIAGKQAADIKTLRSALAQSTEGHESVSAYDATMRAIIDEILDALAETDSHRLSHKGMSGLLAQPEFHESDRVKALIELVDDGLSMLDVVGEAFDTTAVTVRIGTENRNDGLDGVSIVFSPYTVQGSTGVVGVVGPTRMNYLRTISAVSGAAGVLSHLLESSDD